MSKSRWMCLKCGNPAINISVVNNVIHIHCDKCHDLVTMYFNSQEELDDTRIGEVFDFYVQERC